MVKRLPALPEPHTTCSKLLLNLPDHIGDGTITVLNHTNDPVCKLGMLIHSAQLLTDLIQVMDIHERKICSLKLLQDICTPPG